MASLFQKTIGTTSQRLPKPTTESAQLKWSESYGCLPLYFEANRGQTDPQVRFFSRGSGYSLFITPREAVLTLNKKNIKRNKGEKINSWPPTPKSPLLTRDN